MKFPISLFRGAGATGHVFLLNGGKTNDKGLAYSGLIGPMTTVAVVPTVPQILDFSVEAISSDKQKLTVAGSVTITLILATAVKSFDFTVANNGQYVNANEWTRLLHSLVTEQVLEPIRTKASTSKIEEALKAQKEFGDSVLEALQKATTVTGKGITFVSCSISDVEATDNQVADAIGAKDKELMLTEADKARHDRRTEASKNDRALKTYEAQTLLALEEERKNLIEKQSDNKKAEADADADVIKKKLAALNETDAGKVLSSALLEFAKNGRVGTLNIGPELFTAMQQSK